MHDSTKFALNYEEKDISLANLSSTGKKTILDDTCRFLQSCFYYCRFSLTVVVCTYMTT